MENIHCQPDAVLDEWSGGINFKRLAGLSWQPRSNLTKSGNSFPGSIARQEMSGSPDYRGRNFVHSGASGPTRRYIREGVDDGWDDVFGGPLSIHLIRWVGDETSPGTGTHGPRSGVYSMR